MNEMPMEDAVASGKLVELTYKVIDAKTRTILTQVEFPIGYVHGINQVLAPQVTAELEGRLPGDVIEVPIDCNKLFGPRDEGREASELIRLPRGETVPVAIPRGTVLGVTHHQDVGIAGLQRYYPGCMGRVNTQQGIG